MLRRPCRCLFFKIFINCPRSFKAVEPIFHLDSTWLHPHTSKKIIVERLELPETTAQIAFLHKFRFSTMKRATQIQFPNTFYPLCKKSGKRSLVNCCQSHHSIPSVATPLELGFFKKVGEKGNLFCFISSVDFKSMHKWWRRRSENDNKSQKLRNGSRQNFIPPLAATVSFLIEWYQVRNHADA